MHGEDIVHATANDNLSFASGWLFLLIVLGSVLTFTLFTTISASFYCCQKPIKKKEENQVLLNESHNGGQKPFFSNVPSTVYPTTQSILQQEDNEVIDSLTPAYRELPSSHFCCTCISSFNGSTTFDQTCCGNKQSTTLPDSTKCSIHPHTCTISSEQTNTSANDSNTFKQSLTNPDLNNDSSLSIRIASAPPDPQQCMTSSTSGILTEGEFTTTQSIAERDSEHVVEQAMNGEQSNEFVVNDQWSNEHVVNGQQLNEPVVYGKRSNEPAINDPRSVSQRLGAKEYGAIENEAMFYAEKAKHERITSSRGASCFRGIDLEVELSPKSRAFSPDYYALTFRREGSMLSDDSGYSLRGASAFAPSYQRRAPIIVSPGCEVDESERGASVFGETSDVEETQGEVGSCKTMKETEEPYSQAEALNFGRESLFNGKARRSISRHSGPITTTLLRHEIESNTPKLQHESEIQGMKQHINEGQHMSDSITVPYCTKSSIITRPNSKTKHSYKANFEEEESGFGPSLLYLRKDNSYCENSLLTKSQNYHNAKKVRSPSNSSTNNYTRPNCKQPITRLGNISRDNSKPITILQNTPSKNTKPIPSLESAANHRSKPMRNHDTENKLNTTYHSLRGASQLGDDDDVCSDSDAFLDSVSLSFAYESPNEEDFGFEGN